MQAIIFGLLGLSAVAEGRNFILNYFSSSAIEYAVANRSPNFPQSSASEVAKKIVDGFIDAPQVNAFVESAEQIGMKDGRSVPPSDLLKMAHQASNAYQEMKASSGFSNYLHYVGQQAKHFDVKKMYTPPNNQQGAQMNAQIQQALTQLQQTAEGRETLQVVDSLMSEIEHDTGVTIPRRPRM